MAFSSVWPQPEVVNLGPLTDFPPAAQPYRVVAKGQVYIVHTPTQLFVFKPETPHRTNHPYAWSEFGGFFSDPLTASRFGLDGTYICGVADRNLDQFAYEIRAGNVWVNLSTVIKGKAVPRKKVEPYSCLES